MMIRDNCICTGMTFPLPPLVMPLTAPHYTANATIAHAANRLKGNTMKLLLCTTLSVLAGPLLAAGVVYEGGEGPGKGKHIVLVSGDEEYRSEEALPQLAKILAKHHGFKCTVLFAINPDDNSIDPNKNNNIAGLEALKTADLMILFTRFR